MRPSDDQFNKLTKIHTPSRRPRERVRLEENDRPKRPRKKRVRLCEVEFRPTPARRRKHFGRPMTSLFKAIAERNPKRFYLTTAHAAHFLGLSPKTLANWRVRGVGPAFRRFGRAVRYQYAELKRWAAKGDRGSTTEPA